VVSALCAKMVTASIRQPIVNIVRTRLTAHNVKTARGVRIVKSDTYGIQALLYVLIVVLIAWFAIQQQLATHVTGHIMYRTESVLRVRLDVHSAMLTGVPTVLLDFILLQVVPVTCVRHHALSVTVPTLLALFALMVMHLMASIRVHCVRILYAVTAV